MTHLLHRAGDREQLISWLLVRMRGTEWEAAFNQAVERYAGGEMWLVGVLLSGARAATQEDLTNICGGIGRLPEHPEVRLLGFYLPFHKDQWVELIYGGAAA
jgi:hypothetical protein